jgi:hypothetical protein
MPDEISDDLDGYAVVAHERHEGVTQLRRRPVLTEPCLLGDGLEGSADMRCIQWCPRLSGEDESVILPALNTWSVDATLTPQRLPAGRPTAGSR